ncbi:MAG: hypothetical protein U0229_21715 [Anaeromyxobacter sp.]
MKDQIEKILAMAREGTLTDAQAAQLIAELTAGGTPAGGAERRRPTPAARGILAGIAEAIRVTAGGTSSAQVYRSELRENELVMSEVGRISGADYVFERNRITASQVKGLELQGAEVTGNVVGMSQLKDVKVHGGKLVDSSVQGSSVEDLTLEESEVEGLSISASSFEDVALAGGSRVAGLEVSASQVEDVVLRRGSSWEESGVNAAQLEDVTLDASHVRDLEVNGSQVSDLTLTGSTVTSSLFRGARVSGVALVSSTLDDVLVTGGEGWRSAGLVDVTFENTKLTKALFTECLLKDVTIRNVTLAEVKVDRVRLQGRVIDGNEAFLQAMGLAPAAQPGAGA